MELTLVNTDPRYAPIKLVEPTTLGYVHIAAEVRPRKLPFLQRLPAGRRKSELIGRLQELARRLEQLEVVEKVTIYDAVAIAPVRSRYLQARGGSVHVARFDIVVLVETRSVAAIREVLLDALRNQAERLHIMAARNAKRVAEVDKTRNGLFLFNYFVADDAHVMLELWDYLAGWYAVETELDNSTLLVPLEGERSDYAAINHARWDESLPRFLWQQLARRSFWTYVVANLEANRVVAMPALYRLAGSSHGAAGSRRPWVLAASVVGLGAGLALTRRRRAGTSTSSSRARR